MPFPSQPPAEQASRREQRRIVLAVALLLVMLAGAGIWAVVRPGGYGGSANGCITVIIPGSTGGGLIRQCGARAQSTCRHSFTSTSRLSALIRPQCRLAGISRR